MQHHQLHLFFETSAKFDENVDRVILIFFNVKAFEEATKMAFLQYIGNENFRHSVTIAKNSPPLTEKEKSSNNSSMGPKGVRSASDKAEHQNEDLERENLRRTMNLNNENAKSVKLSAIEPD